MSLESVLYNALVPVCARVYPDAAPVGATLPYIIYQQIPGGEAPTFVDNLVPSKENARMQIETWSTIRIESKTLIKAVESALTLSTGMQARPLGAAHAAFDEETDLRGMMQDFSIWATR